MNMETSIVLHFSRKPHNIVSESYHWAIFGQSSIKSFENIMYSKSAENPSLSAKENKTSNLSEKRRFEVF
jgi:hypothetical protein